jgi:hypothetical protein
MANLQNDYDNPNDADPIDSAPPRPAILHSGSTAKERADARQQHHETLATHLVENTIRAGHGGHLLGQQGPGNTGHTMPKSDADKQSGQYIPQGYYGTQNKQNLSSDGSGSANFNDQSANTRNYGTVDTND